MRWAGWAHADAATGAFGGAPHGATNPVSGVPKWACERAEVRVRGGRRGRRKEEGGGRGSLLSSKRRPSTT
eukprot:4536915-Pyramimonas_sp.AAC.1